jgi:cytochrome P450
LRAASQLLRVSLPFDEEAWLVTRYGDIVSVLTDPRFGRNPPDFQPTLDVNTVRDFVVRGLNKTLLGKVEHRLKFHASKLLANLGAADFDIVKDYCMPLAALAFCEVFGTHERDRTEFSRNSWSLTPLRQERNTERTSSQAYDWLRSHIKTLIDSAEPHASFDIFSPYRAQISAVSHDQLVELAIAMLVAGNDSAANLLSSAILNLGQTPSMLMVLEQDGSQLPNIVRELTRFDSPVYPGISRYAMNDEILFDQHISRGELILLPIAAAGRDSTAYDHSDVLRLTDSDSRSLAFGYGQHFCPGYALANLIVEIGISFFARAFHSTSHSARFEPTWTILPLRALVGLRLVC